MKGFTIIESIVTIAIVMVISSVAFVGYGTLKARIVLNRAVQKVALDVRKAQNFSSVTASLTDGSVPCGYGIHYIDNNSYIIFANTQDGALDNCSDSNKFYDGGDIIVENIKIEQQKIIFDGSLSPFSDILFLPPDPITYINGIFDPGDRSIIGLCFQDDCSLIFKRVEIWGTGLIDIE